MNGKIEGQLKKFTYLFIMLVIILSAIKYVFYNYKNKKQQNIYHVEIASLIIEDFKKNRTNLGDTNSKAISR